MRQQLSGHCVPLTGVWQQGCQKYPSASDTSSDSGVQGPVGDSSFRHAHVASARPAYVGSDSKAPAATTQMQINLKGRLV